ncbi:conserved hypothetical protein [Desulforamulus reducens MI-1]|uniref:DUF4363 family protein n=1 Tax=Desulforamulus reducens (strain ATCC BAA-1160 / DSM 100696 / MI-1) TaxID=349161 RepID=A4J4J7_DESRM|nr:DUF4363 family protein [Desulforamulus reducens]ABO50000.1 conserved hypothetical protein [Desulforamulus reducens MI-1]
MRLLLSLTLVIALIIGLGVWVNYSLAVAAEDLTELIHQVTREVERENWQAANGKMKSLEKQWDETGVWWPVVMDHQEIDNIDFSLAKLKEYIATNDRSLSMGYLSELKLMILHLPENEAVNLKNIL